MDDRRPAAPDPGAVAGQANTAGPANTSGPANRSGPANTSGPASTSRPGRAGLPDDLLDLLTTDRLAHVAASRPDGSIAMYLMWVDWDGEHVLISSSLGSRKGSHWRRDPRATLSVVDRDDPWRYMVIRGRVTDIGPDPDLAFIDRMSARYTGQPYHRRAPREIFVITPDHVRASRGRRLPPAS